MSAINGRRLWINLRSRSNESKAGRCGEQGHVWREKDDDSLIKGWKNVGDPMGGNSYFLRFQKVCQGQGIQKMLLFCSIAQSIWHKLLNLGWTIIQYALYKQFQTTFWICAIYFDAKRNRGDGVHQKSKCESILDPGGQEHLAATREYY